MTRRGALGLLLVAGILAGACTGGRVPERATPPAAVSPDPSPSPVPTGPESAAAALRRLCDRPPPQKPPRGHPEGAPDQAPPPPAIAEIVREVEEVRGLEFREPVRAEPLTRREIASRISAAFERSFPADLFERRSRAWRAMGALPAGVSIREAQEEFLTSQVIGFYLPATGELVFAGTEEPTGVEHIALAHELTHAIEDQRFDYRRLDELEAGCADEALDAAVGAVEGTAQFYSARVAAEFLSAEELGSALAEQAPSVENIPRFIIQQEIWPYLAGQQFVAAVYARGGSAAVNAALRDLPVSTEQIIHPERYPNDTPRPVDVPDWGGEIGPGWEDLDVQEVGEAWLSIFLALRLDSGEAREATAGWDGGLYRAWAEGDRVAVAMATVWDTAADAKEFAAALERWAEGEPVSVEISGDGVLALFGSDPGALDALARVVSVD